MSYENAPATRMLATHCLVCGRPLVDAVSVEAGIGPFCREEYGYTVDVSDDARSTANAIIHRIALGIPLDELIPACEALRGYGFDKLADTVLSRKATIVVEDRGDGTLAVSTPYDAEFVGQLKIACPWRSWDGAAKVWVVPAGATTSAKLWAAMRQCFPKALALGPKGPRITSY